METLQDEWLKRYAQIAEGNRRRFNQLRDVLSRLDARDAQALPIKGTDFLLRAYGNLGQRPMYDVDLLIHQKDLPVIARALEEAGFQISIPHRGIFSESFFNDSLDYLSADRSLGLDLVWDVWYLKAARSLWDRSVTRSTTLGKRRFLHPEDALLLQMAQVVCRRGYFSRILVDDVHALVASERDHIDWERWIRTVKDLGLTAAVAHALRYIERQIPGQEDIPVFVFDRLRPRSLSEICLSRYFRRTVTEQPPPSVQYLFPVIATPGWRSKFQLIWRSLYPSEFWIRWRLGKPLSFPQRFLYVLRPLRLIVKGLGHLIAPAK